MARQWDSSLHTFYIETSPIHTFLTIPFLFRSCLIFCCSLASPQSVTILYLLSTLSPHWAIFLLPTPQNKVPPNLPIYPHFSCVSARTLKAGNRIYHEDSLAKSHQWKGMLAFCKYMVEGGGRGRINQEVNQRKWTETFFLPHKKREPTPSQKKLRTNLKLGSH